MMAPPRAFQCEKAHARRVVLELVLHLPPTLIFPLSELDHFPEVVGLSQPPIRGLRQVLIEYCLNISMQPPFHFVYATGLTPIGHQLRDENCWTEFIKDFRIKSILE